MNAKSLISRYYIQQATAQDVQIAMVQGIRSEYEHNLSQQLYVSHEVWQTISTVMEQEITMLNRIGASCEMGASATEFIKKNIRVYRQYRIDNPYRYRIGNPQQRS